MGRYDTFVTLMNFFNSLRHICVGKQTIIGSVNGLSPGRRQAIIWTNAGILLIWPLGTNFSEILIKSLTFSFTKMRLNVSSAKWRPFCLGLNVLGFNKQNNFLTDLHFEWKLVMKWGLWCQKWVSRAGTSNYIPHFTFTVESYFLYMSMITASGTKMIKWALPCRLYWR